MHNKIALYVRVPYRHFINLKKETPSRSKRDGSKPIVIPVDGRILSISQMRDIRDRIWIAQLSKI